MQETIQDYLEEVRQLTKKYMEKGFSRALLLNHLEGWPKQVRSCPNMMSDDPLERLTIGGRQ